MKERKRLDVLVYEGGFAQSREKAKALIMAGQVYVNGQKELKAGTQLEPDAKIEIRGSGLPYVSRGGLKLEKALRVFDIRLDGAVCLDAGASSGGFTDCMLQNGASRVYAIDVGYGQLDWKLRQDERVINFERTNFRKLSPDSIDEKIDFATADLSFISLKLILPVLRSFLEDGASCVCLVKPQFEAGRDKIGKNGVVRELSVHTEVLKDIASFASGHGFEVKGLDFSPIKGPEGNIEFLLYLRKTDDAPPFDEKEAERTAKRAHELLNDKSLNEKVLNDKSSEEKT